MPIHRIVAIPGKFKERKKPDPNQPETIVAERIKRMKDRRAAAQKIGIKPTR